MSCSLTFKRITDPQTPKTYYCKTKTVETTFVYVCTHGWLQC